MKTTQMNRKNYEARLDAFLSQISYIQALAPKESHLYEIMDTVPFRDLETALMMATMETNSALYAAE